MKVLLTTLALSILSAVAAEQAPKPVADQAQRRAEHVFIISYDQGAPVVLEKADMPLFDEMVKQGAHTWEAYTIVPSITLPSHTSMLTGVGIQKHQILWNDYQPAKGPVQVPTIFKIAKDQGLKTAMYVGKEKFKQLEIPGSLDVFSLQPGDMDVARAFAAEVATLKPNLCFLHFALPDTSGHRFGQFSPEQMKVLAECDVALKIIRDAIEAAGLTDSSVIIITADHGGHNVPQKPLPGEVAPNPPKMVATHGSPNTEDVVIPWIAWGHGVKKDYTITAPVVQYDTAATALWLLGIPLPESFWGRPVVSAFQ